MLGLHQRWRLVASDSLCSLLNLKRAFFQSRGIANPGLLLGIAIAIPSGLGVGLSGNVPHLHRRKTLLHLLAFSAVVGNNTSSLVGVAISASLLPPAVNTGICL